MIAALAPTVWGSTYLVTTELLPPGRPLLTATLRALPVGLLLTLRARELPSGAWWWRSAVLGTLNIGAFFALLFVAAYRLPGGVAATAGAIQPLVVAGLAWVLLGEALRPVTALAGATGILGVGLLVLGPEVALDPVGVAAAVAGTLSMASGVVLTKRWQRPTHLLTATGWQLGAGGLALLPVALLVEGPPPALTATNLGGYAWLAIVGTGAAYAAWFRGIDRLPVSALAFLGLLSPLVATLLGWIVLDQHLTVAQLAGVGLILAAIALPHVRTARVHDQQQLQRPQLRGGDRDQGARGWTPSGPSTRTSTPPSVSLGASSERAGRTGQDGPKRTSTTALQGGRTDRGDPSRARLLDVPTRVAGSAARPSWQHSRLEGVAVERDLCRSPAAGTYHETRQTAAAIEDVLAPAGYAPHHRAEPYPTHVRRAP
jgi:probable blue pigment (indigoidine) exporter